MPSQEWRCQHNLLFLRVVKTEADMIEVEWKMPAQGRRDRSPPEPVIRQQACRYGPSGSNPIRANSHADGFRSAARNAAKLVASSLVPSETRSRSAI